MNIVCETLGHLFTYPHPKVRGLLPDSSKDDPGMGVDGRPWPTPRRMRFCLICRITQRHPDGISLTTVNKRTFGLQLWEDSTPLDTRKFVLFPVHDEDGKKIPLWLIGYAFEDPLITKASMRKIIS